MALAVSNRSELVDVGGGGPRGTRFVKATITFDGAYQAGGYGGLANLLQFATLLALIPITRGGYDYEYSTTTDKLKITFGTGSALSGPHTEVTTNLAALNGLAIDVLAIGQ